MARIAMLALLAVTAGCLDTNVSGGDVGSGSSAAGMSPSGSIGGSPGGSPSGSTGGSGTAAAGGSTGGATVGAAAGTSGGAGTTSSGANGGTTTGFPTLAQTCTDYFDGASHIDQCTGANSPPGTVEECEAILAVCSAQDDALIDGVGVCFSGLDCSSPVLRAETLLCAASLLEVSPACIAAVTDGGGGQPPH